MAEGHGNVCTFSKKSFHDLNLHSAKGMKHGAKKMQRVLWFTLSSCSARFASLLFDEQEHHPEGRLTFP
jgi:hypothetical protein